MAYLKADVLSGPEPADGKLVFMVSVDGIFVKLSTYRALTRDADRDSLEFSGQAHSPVLHAMARDAVMRYALVEHADHVRNAFAIAKSQLMRLRADPKGSWPETCPRCGTSMANIPPRTAVNCRGCGSSIVLER